MGSRIVAIVGIVLALWMAAGRWLFGIGGPLTLWYLPTLGIAFAALGFWLARRMRITRERGKHTRRATIVTLVLSWACAVGFGFTVPDSHNGELVSIISLASGSDFSVGMSIALCNPLGILAIAFAIAAVGFAIADSKDPKPEEDEDELDTPQMVAHPLA